MFNEEKQMSVENIQNGYYICDRCRKPKLECECPI